MILKDDRGIHIVAVDGIPADTILIAVPAKPGEKQIGFSFDDDGNGIIRTGYYLHGGISLERSIVVKNVKVNDSL